MHSYKRTFNRVLKLVYSHNVDMWSRKWKRIFAWHAFANVANTHQTQPKFALVNRSAEISMANVTKSSINFKTYHHFHTILFLHNFLSFTYIYPCDRSCDWIVLQVLYIYIQSTMNLCTQFNYWMGFETSQSTW